MTAKNAMTVNRKRLAKMAWDKSHDKDGIRLKPDDRAKSRVTEEESRLCKARRKAEEILDELRLKRELEL